jgi:predicted ABC-type ATPase
LSIRRFVNADVIAKGLSGFDPDSVAFAAGRLMLQRIRELAAARESFAFETTLASRSFAVLLRELSNAGYEVLVYYVWLRSPELAIERVHERVRRDGHFVPPDVIRRRYGRGLRNFFSIYQPLANSWALCDNSGEELQLVAEGGDAGLRVFDPETYEHISREA